MKKSKLFLLLAALLVSAMLLTSCGSVAMTEILNGDYDPSADVYADASSITELEGYALLMLDVDVDPEDGIDVDPEPVVNEEFAVFVKTNVTDEGTATVSYKVLGLRSGEVVGTFAAVKTAYDFTLYDNIPMFQVKKTVSVEKTIQNEGSGETTLTTYKTDYAMYDGAGEKIDASKNELKAPVLFADMVVYDCVGYTAEDDGSLTKEVDIPEYIQLEACIVGNGYYYVTDGARVTVYDEEFAYVSTWAAPTYGEGCQFHFLNDGNVLAQYRYQVDEDAKKFDYIEGNGYPMKLELVSVLFDVVKGEAKELDLDYLVVAVSPWYSMVDEDETDAEDAQYLASEDFENTAIIAPIENQQINTALENLQFVLMSNKIKVGDSLKVLDDQYPGLPLKIGEDGEGDDLYMVWLYRGAAIIDIEGNVIQMINDTDALTQVGQYFVGETAIYDLTLTEVYNFDENDASVSKTIDNTVFVNEKTENGYKIITFCDGVKDTVFTYNKDAETHDTFKFVEGAECYYIHKVASGDYVYYNAEGSKLITTQVELTTVANNSEFGVAVLCGVKASAEKTVTTYYVFAD